MTTTTLWLLAALLAPTLWALTNVLDAALRKEVIKDDFALTWLNGLIRIPFVILLFCLGGLKMPDALSFWMIFLSGVLLTLPSIFYFKAMGKEDPSRVALLIQLVPFFTFFFAYLLLEERLSGFQLLAFLLLIGGGILAAFKKIKTKWHLSTSLFLIALTAAIWAFSDVLFKKYEVPFVNFYTAFGLYFLGSVFASFLFFLYSKKTSEEVKNPLIYLSKINSRAWILLIVSAFSVNLGTISFMYALTLKEASLTAVIMGIQPLLVLFLGFLLDPFIREIKKESITKDVILFKGLSFFLIIAGITLLQLK